ncbi:4-hydroxythreonine-4-phosphate dehydrogenase PdxA [bacterium]|nr:4-hydroxythreonine-4-phosphate dehydrogenase PdxA [bacterium]
MIIGITIGDPAGIGPEIAIKEILEDEIRNKCIPLLIGSSAFIQEYSEKILKSHIRINSVKDIKKIITDPKIINVYDTGDLFVKDVCLGYDSELGGKESIKYLETSVDLLNAKQISAVATCPISKKSISMAGFGQYPGHTEFFAQKSNTKKYLMAFYSGELKLALVTRHVALKDVSKNLTTEKILEVIDIIVQNQHLFGCKNIKIGVCGLNPHAGENGIIGQEEGRIIQPAVIKAKAKGFNVEGPFPSDTIFIKQNRDKYDFIIAMYHDQGLIPFKMLAFDTGVNVTLGLPFVRTSVDHGTAFDIAGKGVADTSSLREAVKLAVGMVECSKQKHK